MATLPLELIVDILSYLPVKSLCRFRCVSKLWLSVISDPQFVKLHLARTQRQKIFLAEKSFFSVDLDSFLNTKSYEKLKVHPVKHDGLKENPDKYWHKIFGSNGLFCSWDLGDFYIYNPFTGESKKIPRFLPTYLSDWFTVLGFGYAESIDDYKIVDVESKEIMHIFSLKYNSWKTIEIDFPVAMSFGVGGGIALNGAIHWIYEGVIHVFDLVEEKFKNLPLPDSFPKNRSWLRNLGDQYLSVRNDNNFWIMKEYGVKESWTRVEIANDFYEKVNLLFWKDNGMMLWVSTSDSEKIILLYQIGGKIFKEVEIDEIHRPYHTYGATVCIGSPRIYGIGVFFPRSEVI